MVAAVDDTLTAFDWIRAHRRQLRIHLKHLGVAGASAGAITSDHVAYALDDLGVRAPRLRFVGDLWGGIFIPLANPQAAADQLEPGEASLFAVHGSADPTVPVILDDWLTARAADVGVPVEYHRIEGGQHGFGGTGFFTHEVAPGETSFDRMLDFAQTALDRGHG
jgi:acetyl esterase/lipase